MKQLIKQIITDYYETLTYKQAAEGIEPDTDELAYQVEDKLPEDQLNKEGIETIITAQVEAVKDSRWYYQLKRHHKEESGRVLWEQEHPYKSRGLSKSMF